MSRNFIPDQVLIDQLPLNDTEAFEEIYHRYCFPLYSYCNGKLQSPKDAKEIVRDLFISLWEKRQELPADFSVSLFLYLEVRKSVVKCVNKKLNEGKDLSMITDTVIPAFSMDNLQQARNPVRQSRWQLPDHYFPAPSKNKHAELWWSQYLPQVNLKGFRYAFQRVMHLF